MRWLLSLATLLLVLSGCTVYVTPQTLKPIICMEGTVLDKDTGQELSGFRCVPEDYNR